jgi:hypothetical protein
MVMSDQLHGPAALPQGKSPWYPLGRRLSGPQSRSGHGSDDFHKLRYEGRVIRVYTTFVIFNIAVDNMKGRSGGRLEKTT